MVYFFQSFSHTIRSKCIVYRSLEKLSIGYYYVGTIHMLQKKCE